MCNKSGNNQYFFLKTFQKSEGFLSSLLIRKKKLKKILKPATVSNYALLQFFHIFLPTVDTQDSPIVSPRHSRVFTMTPKVTVFSIKILNLPTVKKSRR